MFEVIGIVVAAREWTVEKMYERQNAEYKLKNCPMCGGYALPMFEDFGETAWIQCEVCGVRTSKYPMEPKIDGKSGGQWAIESWNRRVK